MKRLARKVVIKLPKIKSKELSESIQRWSGKGDNGIVKIKSRVYRSGGYGMMLTLNKHTAQELGIEVGTVVEQWKHPTMKGVLCIRKVKK